jgi:undecaprenyl-diphosphatase
MAKQDEPADKPSVSEKLAPKTAPKPVRNYRAYLFQIYVVIAIVAFAALLYGAKSIPYFHTDLVIVQAVQSIRWNVFDVLMQLVSDIGFSPQSWVIAGTIVLMLFLIGLRWESVVALFAAGGVSALGALIKLYVGRPRPPSDLVNVFAVLNDSSFPSGHVLYYTAFFGFLCFLFFTVAPHGRGRMVGILVTGALVALVGLSRIYLGQHWPSDVLGAYLLGSVWLALSITLYRWGKPRFFVHQPAAPEAPKGVPAQPAGVKSHD